MFSYPGRCFIDNFLIVKILLPHLNPLQRRGLEKKKVKSPSPLERGWG